MNKSKCGWTIYGEKFKDIQVERSSKSSYATFVALYDLLQKSMKMKISKNQLRFQHSDIRIYILRHIYIYIHEIF